MNLSSDDLVHIGNQHAPTYSTKSDAGEVLMIHSQGPKSEYILLREVLTLTGHKIVSTRSDPPYTIYVTDMPWTQYKEIIGQ